MYYRITRDGELLGSYSLLQLQRHLASGQVLETDLAQAEGVELAIPVS